MALLFYVPHDEHGWLSNLSPHGVELDGRWWPSVEHYFQAAKFAETDPAHAEAIRRAHKARDAARMGRDRSHPMRSDWDAVKEDVMRRALRKKFSTHPELRDRLIATADEVLIEDSPGDAYWGRGPDGAGLNRLGNLLMEVRAELKAARGA